MPRPTCRPDPDKHCIDCPLCGQQPNPVPPRLTLSPDCVVVCEHPGPWDTTVGEPLSGNVGKLAAAELAAAGLHRVAVIYRIACYPTTVQKRSDKNLRLAAKCCYSRFMAALGKLDPHGDCKLLFWGKHSTYGILGKHKWRMRSGLQRELPLGKLCKNVPVGRYMVMDHPRVPFWYKTPMQVPWRAALQRWAAHVRGDSWGHPPQPIIHVGEEMLQALRRIGDPIGVDVETLGVDPLTAPVTCIGIADQTTAVSLPWEGYDTASQGLVRGIGEYGLIGEQIRQLTVDILRSSRTQVTQNGTYDELAGEAAGLPIRNDADIMHKQKILYPEIPANLEAIALQHVRQCDHRWKWTFKPGEDDADLKGSDAWRENSEIDLRHYNGLDAWHTVAASPILDALLAEVD